MKSNKDWIYDVLMEDYKNLGTNMIWKMKDGTEISICNMETSHIRNCINMLKRNQSNSTREAWIDIFNDALLKRRDVKLDKLMKIINDKNK